MLHLIYCMSSLNNISWSRIEKALLLAAVCSLQSESSFYLHAHVSWALHNMYNHAKSTESAIHSTHIHDDNSVVISEASFPFKICLKRKACKGFAHVIWWHHGVTWPGALVAVCILGCWVISTFNLLQPTHLTVCGVIILVLGTLWCHHVTCEILPGFPYNQFSP